MRVEYTLVRQSMSIKILCCHLSVHDDYYDDDDAIAAQRQCVVLRSIHWCTVRYQVAELRIE